MSKEPAKSAVLVRLDKIGDLVCTLPVDQIKELKDWNIHWVISQGLEPLCENAVPTRHYLSLSLIYTFNSFRKLLRFLQATKPQLIVVFYAPWWVSLACFISRAPLRTTRLSQWHSFLFFNRGLRQSRSEALKHEADYNLQLLQHALGIADNIDQAPVLKIKPRRPELSMALPAAPYFIVHPGMFGSALNWPPLNYSQLIDLLIHEFPKHHVIVTGTLQDESALQIVKKDWSQHERVHLKQAQWNLSQLLWALSQAVAVFAPSTGVLHLAASIGTVSLGIYSPVLVHRSLRWGPRGEKALAITPQVQCPGRLDCLGSACSEHPCMNSVSPAQVLAAAKSFMNEVPA